MVYEKLAKIQQTLVATKDNFNEFGKYKYRSAENIYEAVKPHLKAMKLALTLSDEMQCIGDRNYIKTTARLVDVEDGSFVETTAFAREELTKKGMDGSQITGASSSYARKYCLGGLFLLDDNKDSDATNRGDEEPSEHRTASKSMRCVDCGMELKKVVNGSKTYEPSEWSDITIQRFGKRLCKACALKELDRLEERNKQLEESAARRAMQTEQKHEQFADKAEQAANSN